MKKRISFKKVGLLVLFIISLGVVIHDFITILSGATFTWFGFATFICAVYVCDSILDYFQRQ